MIVGNRARFAIEAMVSDRPDGWILGYFRFWINGQEVGDWSDCVDLKGCVQWLLDFASNPRDRYHPGLATIHAEEVFEKVHDPVMNQTFDDSKQEFLIMDAFARFHITHLGMSSFESFDILMVTDEVGLERVLWRSLADPEIKEGRFESGELESVALLFCAEFQKEIGDQRI